MISEEPFIFVSIVFLSRPWSDSLSLFLRFHGCRCGFAWTLQQKHRILSSRSPGRIKGNPPMQCDSLDRGPYSHYLVPGINGTSNLFVRSKIILWADAPKGWPTASGSRSCISIAADSSRITISIIFNHDWSSPPPFSLIRIRLLIIISFVIITAGIPHQQQLRHPNEQSSLSPFFFLILWSWRCSRNRRSRRWSRVRGSLIPGKGETVCWSIQQNSLPGHRSRSREGCRWIQVRETTTQIRITWSAWLWLCPPLPEIDGLLQKLISNFPFHVSSLSSGVEWMPDPAGRRTMLLPCKLLVWLLMHTCIRYLSLSLRLRRFLAFQDVKCLRRSIQWNNLPFHLTGSWQGIRIAQDVLCEQKCIPVWCIVFLFPFSLLSNVASHRFLAPMTTATRKTWPCTRRWYDMVWQFPRRNYHSLMLMAIGSAGSLVHTMKPLTWLSSAGHSVSCLSPFLCVCVTFPPLWCSWPCFLLQTLQTVWYRHAVRATNGKCSRLHHILSLPPVVCIVTCCFVPFSSRSMLFVSRSCLLLAIAKQRKHCKCRKAFRTWWCCTHLSIAIFDGYIKALDEGLDFVTSQLLISELWNKL